ncbi:hypothetical protein GFL86_28940 [Rhizobium laguerreae]|nr:hypothetical protein [Rhizobium laguerreae]
MGCRVEGAWRFGPNQDPSPTPPHKGEGLNLPHPFSRSATFRVERGGRSGLVPPPCGEGLGRGLSQRWTGNGEGAECPFAP